MAERVLETPEPEIDIPQALFAHAVDTFGDVLKAKSWLTTPNLALNNESPVKLASTPAGVEQVEQILTRIDYGIFS